MTNDKRWLTPTDLEAEFTIKKGTQKQWRRERKIPYSKVGGFIYYDRVKIDKWLEDHSLVE